MARSLLIVAFLNEGVDCVQVGIGALTSGFVAKLPIDKTLLWHAVHTISESADGIFLT